MKTGVPQILMSSKIITCVSLTYQQPILSGSTSLSKEYTQLISKSDFHKEISIPVNIQKYIQLTYDGRFVASIHSVQLTIFQLIFPICAVSLGTVFKMKFAFFIEHLQQSKKKVSHNPHHRQLFIFLPIYNKVSK